MVYKIYPLFYWIGTTLGCGIPLYTIINLNLSQWYILGAWLIGLITGIIFGQITVAIFPRAKYINKTETDGQGFIHSNVDWVIQWFVILLSYLIYAILITD